MHLHTTNAAQPVLGPQFAPSFHRPWLRYVEAVDGAEGKGTEGTEGEGDAEEPKGVEAMTEEELRAALTKVRREAADKRTKARDATADAAAAKAERDALTQTVLTALGIQSGDAPVTVESLQASLTDAATKTTAAEERATQLARTNAVLLHAADAGGNAARLLDSNSFTTKLSAVDPSDAEAVKAAIKAAVQADAGLALVKVAGSSGSANHTGGDSTNRSKDMREAASRRLGFTQ